MTPEQATIQALQSELIRAYEDKAREHSRWQSVHADYVNLRERYYELERSLADKLPQVESIKPANQVVESELPDGITVDNFECHEFDAIINRTDVKNLLSQITSLIKESTCRKIWVQVTFDPYILRYVKKYLLDYGFRTDYYTATKSGTKNDVLCIHLLGVPLPDFSNPPPHKK